MDQLRIADACEERHFRDMSLLHALGWRAAYRDSVPGNYRRPLGAGISPKS